MIIPDKWCSRELRVGRCESMILSPLVRSQMARISFEIAGTMASDRYERVIRDISTEQIGDKSRIQVKTVIGNAPNE